jgi:hypothetical protein
LAAVVENTDNIIRLYVNGVLVDANSSAVSAVANATALRFGENAAGGAGAGALLPPLSPPQAVTAARTAMAANAEGIRVWRRECVMGNSSSVAKLPMVMSDGDVSVTLDVHLKCFSFWTFIHE